MAQGLRALAALPWDPVLVPSITVAPNQNSTLRGSDSHRHQVYTQCTDTHAGKTSAHIKNRMN